MRACFQEVAMHLLKNWNDCLAGATIIIPLDITDQTPRQSIEAPRPTQRESDGHA